MKATIVLCILISVISLVRGDNNTCGTQVGGKVLKNQSFTTTFESFFPLVDRDYRIRCLYQDKFQEYVSLSMYRYWMAQHLYARLIELRSHSGLATSSEIKLHKHLYSISPKIPSRIFEYLSMIGDLAFESIEFHQLNYKFLTWPNRQGHFGVIDANNHWMYMSFPAPSVVAQAIREDYHKTVEPTRNPYWDLRPHLFPKSKHTYPGSPTANLLGWKPTVILTPTQRAAIASCGITELEFDEINAQFFFNPKLIRFIALAFDYGNNMPYKPVSTFRERVCGSLLQLGWLERNQQDDRSVSRSFSSVERSVIGKLHPFQEHGRKPGDMIEEKTLVVGFRVNKLSGVVNDWAIYDWQKYQSVPPEWIETRNTVFEFGGMDDIVGKEISISDQRDRLLDVQNLFD